MTILTFFDAFAQSYEIKGELSGTAGMDGVASVKLLQKSGGEATTYCLWMEVDDAKSDDIMQRIKSRAAQYTGYVSNLKIMGYKLA